MKSPGTMPKTSKTSARDASRSERANASSTPGGAIADLQKSYGNQSLLRMLDRAAPVIQRKKCACGGEVGANGECAECKAKREALQRRAMPGSEPTVGIPAIVDEVIHSSGQPLDASTRAGLEPHFGQELGAVRIHTGSRAAASAKAVNAVAYTVGRNIVFGQGQHAPHSASGRHLLAHELAHVIQQSHGASHIPTSPQGIAPADGAHERQADAAADAVVARGRAPALSPASGSIQRRPAPYIKKVTVHLAPPQSAELDWQGTPPVDATGSDKFTVSTGKGYDNPGDPPRTCTRHCCKDADKQCAPPWNTPDKIGACCTPHGSTFWTGKPRVEHNGWKWWTPIQPFYSKRGIALHQHHEVTGEPIGHGCVRMDEGNAKRIFDYSNGQKTNVTIDGRAAPVACEKDRQCGATSSSSGAMREGGEEGSRLAEETPATPGLEGVQS